VILSVSPAEGMILRGKSDYRVDFDYLKNVEGICIFKLEKKLRLMHLSYVHLILLSFKSTI